MVTHGIGYLKEMDDIIVLKDGEISEQGSYDELMQAGGAFADFLVQHLNEDVEEDPETETEMEELRENLEIALGKSELERKLSIARSQKSNLSDLMGDKESSAYRRRKLSRAISGISHATTSKDSRKIRGEKLIEEEKAEIGGVKWDVYYGYAKSIGLLFSVCAIGLYAAFQGFSLGGNIWLSRWSTDPLATTDISVRNKYLIVYGVLGLLQAMFVMLATGFIQIGSLKASLKLHNSMLDGIMHSTMAFFDTTPLGRILNRFSKDVDIMDITIPMNTRMLLVQFFNVAGTIVVICYSNAIFIAVVIPIMIL